MTNTGNITHMSDDDLATVVARTPLNYDYMTRDERAFLDTAIAEAKRRNLNVARYR